MHHSRSKCQELPAQWSSVNAQSLATWRTAFIAWQCQCIQNVTVGRATLELRRVSRGTILPKIRDWQMRSWLNAIPVAQLEPDRCPAPPEIHPARYILHMQRNMIQWVVWKWSEWRHVGSNVYWTGRHGFGSWNDTDLSGEVSLCLSDEFLTYSIPSTCFMP